MLADEEMPQPKPTLLMYLLCLVEMVWVPTYPLYGCLNFTDELEDPPPPNMSLWVAYKRRWRAFWNRLRDYFTWSFFFVFCLAGFFGETVWVWSLHGTTPPVNNTVCQAGIVFTALLGAAFIRGESIGWWKMWWILVAIAGVGLVSFQVMEDEEEGVGIGVTTWWGIILALMACLISAVEGVYTKYLDQKQNYASLASDEDSEDEEERGPWYAFKDSMVFSTAYSIMMGLSCWVFVVIFHYTGVEEFEMPGESEWLFVTVYYLTSDLYETFECWGLFVAGPMFMEVGSVLVIPMSYIIGIIRGTVWLDGSSWLLIVGTFLCIVGVIFTEWNPMVECEPDLPDDKTEFDFDAGAVGVFKVVAPDGIAYRKTRNLANRVLHVKGPDFGDMIKVAQIRTNWVRCKGNGLWLPIRADNEVLLDLIPVTPAESEVSDRDLAERGFGHVGGQGGQGRFGGQGQGYGATRGSPNATQHQRTGKGNAGEMASTTSEEAMRDSLRHQQLMNPNLGK